MMNPFGLKFTIYAAIAVTAMLFLAMLHHRIYKQGYDAAEAIWEKREASAALVAQQKLTEANDKVRAAQTSLNETLAKIDAKNKEIENAKSQVAALRADLRNGAVRLSVPVASGTCHAAGSVDSSAITTGAGSQAHAELLPTVADDLIGLAIDADNEVRRTNECIDRYNAVKDAITASN